MSSSSAAGAVTAANRDERRHKYGKPEAHAGRSFEAVGRCAASHNTRPAATCPGNAAPRGRQSRGGADRQALGSAISGGDDGTVPATPIPNRASVAGTSTVTGSGGVYWYWKPKVSKASTRRCRPTLQLQRATGVDGGGGVEKYRSTSVVTCVVGSELVPIVEPFNSTLTETTLASLAEQRHVGTGKLLWAAGRRQQVGQQCHDTLLPVTSANAVVDDQLAAGHLTRVHAGLDCRNDAGRQVADEKRAAAADDVRHVQAAPGHWSRRRLPTGQNVIRKPCVPGADVEVIDVDLVISHRRCRRARRQRRPSLPPVQKQILDFRTYLHRPVPVGERMAGIGGIGKPGAQPTHSDQACSNSASETGSSVGHRERFVYSQTDAVEIGIPASSDR